MFAPELKQKFNQEFKETVSDWEETAIKYEEADVMKLLAKIKQAQTKNKKDITHCIDMLQNLKNQPAENRETFSDRAIDIEIGLLEARLK